MSKSRSQSSTKAELGFELSLSVQLPPQLSGPRSRSSSKTCRCSRLQAPGRALTPPGAEGRQCSAGRIFVQPGSRVSGQGCCSSRCGFSKAFGTERAGGSPRPPRFVSPPAPGGPAGTGAGPASRRGHRASAPGRAGPGSRSAPRRGQRGGVGRGGKEGNAAGAGSKLRPSPTERRERPGPAGSVRGRRPRPKRDRTSSSLPSPPCPPAPGPRPRAPPLAARKFPREAAGTKRRCSPGAETFPGAVSAPQGAASPAARALSAASGLAGPRALSACRAATCPRVAGERRGSAGGARAGALLRSGRGGAPAAQRTAYSPPRPQGALWDRSSSTARRGGREEGT